MTGEPSEHLENELDVYFDSNRFRKRLDEVRKTLSPQLLMYAAVKIVFKLNLRYDHRGVIHHYLRTGEYKPQATTTSIYIVDRLQKRLPTELNPEEGYKLYEQMMELSSSGVAIEIGMNTRKDELIAYIYNNWPVIKDSLDANYLDRQKRFAPARRIDDWLAIADELNSVTDKKERKQKIEDLAAKYGINETDVRTYAKFYSSILED